jgi:hypothetical protein
MDITVADITNGTPKGNGVFDTLMRASKAHLEAEYNAGRIKGDMYSQVYLSMVNSVLQQATQFVLSKQQADKQAELLAAQIAKTDQDADLVFQQKLNMIAENANIALIGDKLTKEKDLLSEQILKLQEDVLVLQQQKANMVLEANNIPKQGVLLDSQASKLTSDKAVVDQSLVNMAAEKLNIEARTTQVDKTVDKMTAEIAVLDQKKRTEEAQIKDTVDAVTVAGVVGKQKALYTAQTDGFARDAEQKLAHSFMNIWSVQRTTDEGITPAGAGLSDAEIKKVVDAAKSGIGVTPG